MASGAKVDVEVEADEGVGVEAAGSVEEGAGTVLDSMAEELGLSLELELELELGLAEAEEEAGGEG